LTGELEPTNEPYAIAKIAGIKMCDAYRAQYGCDFISVMPTNLYGPNDNYDLKNSHVLPALIRKFHEAKVNNHRSVEIWGTGKPRREFMHVDDLAEACFFLMNHYDEPGFINIGVGEDISIRDLAHLIQKITSFQGKLNFDTSKPDGTPRKLMDVSRLDSLGFKAKITLEAGVRSVYEAYKRKNT
jgi:GDP-L-fucose synthase